MRTPITLLGPLSGLIYNYFISSLFFFEDEFFHNHPSNRLYRRPPLQDEMEPWEFIVYIQTSALGIFFIVFPCLFHHQNTIFSYFYLNFSSSDHHYRSLYILD